MSRNIFAASVMLAGGLEEAMSGCKPRATDFSIAAIMSRGSAAAAAAAAAASGLRRAASPGLPPLGELHRAGATHSTRLHAAVETERPRHPGRRSDTACGPGRRRGVRGGASRVLVSV